MTRPKINQSKYENAILYLCENLGGSIFGKKKLAKLLYYIDFDNFEYKESMRSITGDQYDAWKMGPVPEQYTRVINAMVKNGKLKRSQQTNPGSMRPTEIFTANAAADLSEFTDDEKYIMSRVVKKYGNLDGKQLEALTHAEAPYIATEPSQQISYELAFYRGTDFRDVVAAA